MIVATSPSLARPEVQELAEEIKTQCCKTEQFSQKYHQIMIRPSINDTSPMTVEKAQRKAAEYLILRQALYESLICLDEPFCDTLSRREQGLVWLNLVDNCFDAMKKISHSNNTTRFGLRSILSRIGDSYTRPTQNALWLHALGGCLDSMRNFSWRGDGTTTNLRDMRRKIAELHSQRWQQKRPKVSNGY